MGVMGTPTFNVSAPTIAPPPAPAPRPPAPAPPPPAPVASYKTSKSGKKIPVGQFGNRLDTAAGAKKEAEMAAAAHALKVAHSEAVHGRPENAQEALQKAQQHTNNANVAPAGAFEKAVIRDTNNINTIIQESKASTIPTDIKILPEKGTIPEDPVKLSSPPSSPPPPTTEKIIKKPNRDIVNLEPMIRDAAEIEAILFNQISATELTKLVKHDTISGKRARYSLISDLEKINASFDPSNILVNRSSYDSIFNTFQIKLESKLPTESTYDLNEEGSYPDENLLWNAYWDGQNFVIELENISSTELVEIEIELDGKIYRVRENDNQ